MTSGLSLSSSRKTAAAGVGYALASALGFSTLGIFASTLYGLGFSVQETLAWRFTFASVFLWAFLAVRTAAGRIRAGRAGIRDGEGGKKPSLWPLLLLAIFGFAPQAGLYFLTLRLLSPGLTSLLLYLYPAFVLVFSAVLFRKKPAKNQFAALGLSLAGSVVTFFRAGRYPPEGLALGVLVAVSYAAYLTVGEKILKRHDPFFSTAVIMTVAGIAYWTWALLSGKAVRAPVTAPEWLLVAGIALAATVLPITTLFFAMNKIGASDVSLVSMIEPVATVVLSTLLLGERIGLNQAIGGALIVGGVLSLQLFSRRED